MTITAADGSTVVSAGDTLGKGMHANDGSMRVTLVSGNTYTGLYNADGSINVFIDEGNTPGGAYHPCGALRVSTQAGFGARAPNGSLRVSNLAALDLNFLSGTLDPRITFSRASNATLTDSTGKITYAPNNLLTYSEQFDNAVWVKTDTTVTANATAAPDGTVTADKLIEVATTAFHQTGRNITTTAALHTFSCYAKASERNIVFLYHTQTNAAVSVNLSTGATGQPSGTVAPAASSVVSVGSGWYRIAITVSATAASNFFGVYLSNSLTGGGSYAGDGTSGVFLWGAQLEAVTYQTTPSTYNATTTAAYYGPRFDYDPVTLAAKGLLIEEARTNLATYSQNFTDVSWTQSRVTITTAAGTAPDGTNTANSVIPTATSGQHIIAKTIVSGATNTISWYVKPTGSYTKVAWYEAVNTGYYASFDLTGAGSVLATGTATATVTAVGNGWYRITATAVNPGSTYFSLYFLPQTYTTGAPTGLWTPDGTTGFLVWGGQFEVGAFATSYIPTVAASVARSADLASMTGTNFSSWFNQGPVNLLLQSQTFDNASWSKTDTTVTADAIAAPDGTTTADLLAEGTAGTAITTQSVTTSTPTIATSIYVKAGTATWLRFSLTSGANAVRAWFNAATGAVGTNSVAGTGVFVSANATALASGWYRFTIVGTIPNVTLQSISVNSASADGSGTRVNSASYYLWGAQLEVGSTATTYIPTTTAPVANPPATGSLVVAWLQAAPAVSGKFYNIATLQSDGSNRLNIYISGTAMIPTVTSRASNVQDFSNTFAAISANSLNKIGVSLATNDTIAACNNVLGVLDTSVTPPAINIMNIGGDGGAINGCIQTIRYYRTRLPNAQLQALTV